MSKIRRRRSDLLDEWREYSDKHMPVTWESFLVGTIIDNENQLAECQEKYEHLHQGKTLMEDKWCPPEEYERLLGELARLQEKCKLIEEENKLLDAFKASYGKEDEVYDEC